VFCDTDSIAMARLEEIDQGEFLARVQAVVDWFEGLNPCRPTIWAQGLRWRTFFSSLLEPSSP